MRLTIVALSIEAAKQVDVPGSLDLSWSRLFVVVGVHLASVD
jgi:hypothetical protein